MSRQNKKTNRTILTVSLLAAAVLIGVALFFALRPDRAPAPTEAPQTPALTETPQEPALQATYDKYLISPSLKKDLAPNEAAYRSVFDAADAYAERADVSDFALTEDEVAKISQAIFDRSEFVYLSGMSLSQDGKSIELSYSPAYTKEQALAAKDAFREKVTSMLSAISAVSSTKTDAVLALYTRLSKETTYNEQAEDVGAYGMMVNGEGICTGYAYAMRYVLDQLGIENCLAFSNDESHVWNIVKMNDSFYHLDATWENGCNKAVPTLLYFGQDDAARRQTTGFDGWYTRVNSLQEKQPSPECGNALFAPLAESATAEVDYSKHQIIYTDYNDVANTLNY
ncbi:MAG: transglutaminase domain-containing protein [Oscillospiraceae bacterium]